MSTKSSIYYATDGDYYVHVYNECFDNNNQVHIEAWYYDTDNELYSETLTLTEGLWVALLQEIKTHLEPYLDDAQAEVERLKGEVSRLVPVVSKYADRDVQKDLIIKQLREELDSLVEAFDLQCSRNNCDVTNNCYCECCESANETFKDRLIDARKLLKALAAKDEKGTDDE